MKTTATTTKAAKATTKTAAKAASTHTRTAPKAQEGARTMKATTATTTATAAKKPAIPVVADNLAWKFTPDSVSLDGHTFDASYSVSKSGDVYAYVNVGDTAVRIHVGKSGAIHEAAFDAAMAAKKRRAANKPAKQAEPKAAEAPAEQEPVAPAKPAAKQRKATAKQAAPKAVEAPAKQEKAAPAKPAAKQRKATAKQAAPKAVEAPAKQETPNDRSWIGTTILGTGWHITFDEAAQRTRVCFDGQPSAKQKAAIEAAGFYWSNQLKSWNKKLTYKAYRAAKTLATTLTALK